MLVARAPACRYRMPSSFEPRRLRYFVKVAELGSLTHAAKALHIAQPALSQHMQSIEDELGLKLLERGPRGVRLTEAGQRLAIEARDLLEGVRAMVDRVKGESSEPEGEVVLGVAQTIGSLLVAPLLELAAVRIPRVRIHIRELMSGHLSELVRARAVDFALSYNTTSADGVEVATVLCEDLYLVGQRPLVRKYLGIGDPNGEVRFRDLQGVPLYLSRRSHVLRETIEHLAQAEGTSLSIRAEVDSHYLMKELVLNGAGCSVFSRATVHRDAKHHDLCILRIVEPVVPRDICLLRRHGQILPRGARELAALSVELLGGLVEAKVWPGPLRISAHDIRKSF